TGWSAATCASSSRRHAAISATACPLMTSSPKAISASCMRSSASTRRAASAHDELRGGDPSPEAVTKIARELGVRESEVLDMSRRMGGRDASLNERLDVDGDAERQDFLVDDTPDQEMRLADADELAKRRSILATALDTLSPRERQILVERQLSDEPPTLEDLGIHFGVSRERVRQLEARALAKIGKVVRSEMAELEARQAAG